MAKGDIGWFGFTKVPPLGIRIHYLNQFVTLIDVQPYQRKDGAESWLLRWRSDAGREGTSGLRGNSIRWDRQDQRAG